MRQGIAAIAGHCIGHLKFIPMCARARAHARTRYAGKLCFPMQRYAMVVNHRITDGYER